MPQQCVFSIAVSDHDIPPGAQVTVQDSSCLIFSSHSIQQILVALPSKYIQSVTLLTPSRHYAGLILQDLASESILVASTVFSPLILVSSSLFHSDRSAKIKDHFSPLCKPSLHPRVLLRMSSLCDTATSLHLPLLPPCSHCNSPTALLAGPWVCQAAPCTGPPCSGPANHWPRKQGNEQFVSVSQSVWNASYSGAPEPDLSSP